MELENPRESLETNMNSYLLQRVQITQSNRQFVNSIVLSAWIVSMKVQPMNSLKSID